MQRMTQKNGTGSGYTVSSDYITQADGTFLGPAVDRLASYENVYEYLCAQQEELTEKLDSLKAQGKTNSASFRQMMASRMTNTNILRLLE